MIAIQVCLLALLGLSWVTPVAASPDDAPQPPQDESEADGNNPLDARARKRFEAGKAYFESGDYEHALEEFRAALELSGRSELWFNLAIAHERLRQLPQAIDALEHYLTEVPAISNRRRLELRVQRMRERVHQQQTQAQEEARAAEQARRQAEAKGAAEADAQPHPRRHLDATSITALSVAGAASVMAVVFGPLSLKRRNDLDDQGCKPSCDPDTVQQQRRFARSADAAIGVSVAAAVTALTAWLLSDREVLEDTPTALAPWVRRDGAGVVGRWSL